MSKPKSPRDPSPIFDPETDMVTVTILYIVLADTKATLETRIEKMRECTKNNPIDPYFQQRAQELQGYLTDLERALAARVEA